MSQKRNLPSWMSSRDPPGSKKPKDEGDNHISIPNKEHTTRNAPPQPNQFSKLMEGVVFVLSGFVNPERSTLRSQALAMGATYQPDWNSDSTLLICAFPNTPKFRQVQSNSGTIVSKDWISECFMQKKLVDIEQYLMHPGKPWRKTSVPQDTPIREKKKQLAIKSEENQVETKPETRGTSSASSKNRPACKTVKERFSVTEVKKWAREDLTETISWLESQEEKPEAGEIKRIAAEGVLTCLQDAIDSLEQKQDIGSVTELWSFVPRVVKELGKMESSSCKTENSTASKDELCKQAKSWKKIYEAELAKKGEEEEEASGTKSRRTSGYDSDETVEMTEEEIEHAYRNVSLE
ncbi:unnamed protein product [Eruca vesicaria subsp. sativa]|uniref:BRCT domain-containing protein n=1 Tax=Eruca vesicaria subsp. sativa TaxID=29727 RepID=A0ABC8KAE9_ERUVS|nr:unnamed protein product [Eruca vesicaria subsp. sativa]